MMAEKAATICVSNILARATRERCISKMQKLRIPQKYQKPKAHSSPNAAAILIPVCDVNDKASILYTIRSPNLRSHSGQISFPGGKMDSGETAIQTALRETQEEIGLPHTKIDIWGQGSPVPGRDRIMITPVVGNVLNLRKSDLNINTKEVSEVFAVPIEILCNPLNQYYTQFRNGYILPVFVAEDYKIWGITAYITHTFLNCLLPTNVYKNEWTKKKIDLKEEIVQCET